MNILYGVSGEGFGHASHAIAIAGYLEKRGHNVTIITSGKAYDVLKEKFKVVLVDGLLFVCDKGTVNYIDTAIFNMGNFYKKIKDLFEVRKLFHNFNPDFCITDMEPFVSVLSAAYGIPLISISNQNRFTKCYFDYPKEYKIEYFIAKLIINSIMPWTNFNIALSLENLAKKNKNTQVVSPIIRNEIRKLKPNRNGRIVVYLTRENSDMIRLLKRIKEKFIVFGYNINKKENNIEFKTKDFFLKDFKNCKGFISNSGFTSVGEAVFLRKPYFAIPLKGQFEQIFNALFIKEKGYGKFVQNPKKRDIIDFIKNLKKYSKNLDRDNNARDWDSVFNILGEIVRTFENKV